MRIKLSVQLVDGSVHHFPIYDVLKWSVEYLPEPNDPRVDNRPAKPVDPQAMFDLLTIPPRWDPSHEPWCDLVDAERNSTARCTCRTAASPPDLPAKGGTWSTTDQDLAELPERKEDAGWHLKSCPTATSGGSTLSRCVCGAQGWITRRANRQGEARERVKPRE